MRISSLTLLAEPQLLVSIYDEAEIALALEFEKHKYAYISSEYFKLLQEELGSKILYVKSSGHKSLGIYLNIAEFEKKLVVFPCNKIFKNAIIFTNMVL